VGKGAKKETKRVNDPPNAQGMGGKKKRKPVLTWRKTHCKGKDHPIPPRSAQKRASKERTGGIAVWFLWWWGGGSKEGTTEKQKKTKEKRATHGTLEKKKAKTCPFGFATSNGGEGKRGGRGQEANKGRSRSKKEKEKKRFNAPNPIRQREKSGGGGGGRADHWWGGVKRSHREKVGLVGGGVTP